MALDLSLIPLYYYSSHGEHSCSAAWIEIHFIQVLKKARSTGFFLILKFRNTPGNHGGTRMRLHALHQGLYTLLTAESIPPSGLL